ncbi:hypothetical protein [Peribacillus butanolivorans]|uniref:hypothetical protein n=1 Tax=Peribacillus butanolivorans TaxID=421767 RepID=UPI001596BA0C
MYNTNQIRSRKALDKLKPYTPGNPLWEVQKELGLKRVNENPIGPSPKAGLIKTFNKLIFYGTKKETILKKG